MAGGADFAPYEYRDLTRTRYRKRTAAVLPSGAANDPSNTIRKGKSVEYAVETAFTWDMTKSVIPRFAQAQKRGANRGTKLAGSVTDNRGT